MNKNIFAVLVVLIILIIGGVIFIPKNLNENEPGKPATQKPSSGKLAAFDGKNSTFTIDGKEITLLNGLSETEAAPGSASKITTRYFGNESYGDLTGDGVYDTAFLISQSTGGTGIFYYVVVAITGEKGYKTTNAFLIGDRIAPQTTQINTSARELYVNFAERKAGEPMSAQPSVGATLVLKVTTAGVLEGLMK